MDKVKDFLTTCINYLKANPLYAIILAAALLLIVVVIIILICVSAKKRKMKKRVKAEAAAKAQAEAEQKTKEEQAAAEKKKAEEAEAKRRATLEKLEAERIAAEEAEAAQKAAEAKAEAERQAAAEKAVAERIAKEKAEAERQAAETAAQEMAIAEKNAKEKSKNSGLYEQMKNAKVEDDVWYDENETDRTARYSGKWQVCRVLTDDNAEEEMYFFELHASNGEKLLSSEEYTSYNGALRGIETHKTNILKGNFKITVSKKGDYIFKLMSGKNMLLCMGENYPTKARCESAIESAKRFAKTAILDENIQDIVVKVPVEDDTPITPLPDGIAGKWIIDATDGADGEKLYFFELFANNGEKLLSSEEYTSYVGAVNGIQTHKRNIEDCNFRITLTKRGDYIYKLLNGNGQLLCLGEHYKTKRLCQNAVDSVKRFAANSPILTDSAHTK